MKKDLRPIRWTPGGLSLLEQRLLPLREKWVLCDNVEKAARAIEEMTVRGAPAIGITAAYGVALAARKSKTADPGVFQREILKAVERLRRTRPTAVNLFWALDRMARKLKSLSGKSVPEQKRLL